MRPTAPSQPRAGSRLPAATTSRYAARFQCIGGACEDNCCAHSWRVGVSKSDYVRLERACAGSATERDAFARGCVRDPDAGSHDSNYATLQRTTAGACVFLTADRLCAIHATHGTAVLPQTCATYPRIISRVGRHLSLAATLSCPEAARLCLLADDAVQCEATNPEPLRSFRIKHDLPGAGDDPRVRAVLAIREALLQLCTLGEYPVAARLYGAAHLARRLDALPADRLAEGIAAGTSAEAVAQIDRECRTAPVTGTLPFVLVQQILIALPREPGTARLAGLVDAVYAPFLDRDAGAAGRDGSPAYSLRGAALWEAYRSRRRRWEEAFPERIARYVGNYAANYWLTAAPVTAPDLLPHVLRLLARVAVIRFLLFSHPSLQGEEAGSPPAHAGEALDRAAVEVVYAFSRAVEHSEAVQELLHRVLEACGVRGIGQAAELARF